MESEVKFQRIISLTTSWRLHLTSLAQNNLHSVKNYLFLPMVHTVTQISKLHISLDAHDMATHSMSERIFWNTTTTDHND